MDSGDENDTEVLVEATEMAVAEAAAEMEATKIPDFFMSQPFKFPKLVDLLMNLNP